MRRIVLFFIVLTLTACMDRSQTVIMPAALEFGTLHKVFVATRRQADENGWYSAKRARVSGYSEISVSVPPGHKRGEVELGFKDPDPQAHFTVATRQDSDDRSQFRRALSRHIAAKPPKGREVTLYVHGYNNSYLDGVFRSAQIMHDFSLTGTAVHYAWPSDANPLGYAYDRDSVLFSRDGLEDLLRDVVASGASRVIVVAHSLGTMLTMETLRQIEIGTPGWSKRNLSGLILISPDLDIDLFKTQADRFAELPQPFAIFVSNRDRALMLSARINGDTHRLGTLTEPDELADYPVTLLDVSEFATESGLRHFTPGTAPSLIALLSQSSDLDRAFQRDQAGRSGLLSGTAITVRNATTLILSPHLVLQNSSD